MANTDGRKAQQYLSFSIAGEEHAVPILRVREIIEYDVVTRVPGTPTFIRGVINLRGQVVPVVDLVIRFGLERTQVTKRTCIVIVELLVEGVETWMGILADSVSEVVDFAEDDIEPPPAFGTKVSVAYLTGMGKVGKKFVLILDIDRLLTSDEITSALVLRTEEEAETAAQLAAGAVANGDVNIQETGHDELETT
jgi:purine-binding chemotaxis protein CheW